jgi:cell division protein FtsW
VAGEVRRERRYRRRSPDWWIFVIAMILLGIGIIMVFSASQYYAQYKFADPFHYLKQQVIAAIVGLIALFAVYRMPAKLYKNFSWPVFAVIIGFLLFMIVTHQAAKSGEAERWFSIFGFTFQPSEMAKIAMPMLLARQITRNQQKIKTFRYGFLPCLAIVGITAGLILVQNDLSSALIVAGSGFIMMYCAGVRKTYLTGTLGLGVVGIIAVIIKTPWRLDRLTSFIDPWLDPLGDGMQAVQSQLAIGSGGLSGVGLGNGGSTWFYLPAHHTDFIFSVIAEELGFIGCLLLIALFGILIWRAIIVAVKMPDVYTGMLALGLALCLGIQIILNLWVVTGLVPVTGITLPFISYGGTSLVVSLVLTGMLLNLSTLMEN